MSDVVPGAYAPDQSMIPTGLPGGFFIYDAQGDEEILFAEQNVIELFGCETMAEFREHTHNSFTGMVHPEDLVKIQNDIQAQTFTSERRHDYVRYRIVTKQGEIRYVEDFGHLLHGQGGQKYFYVYIVDVDKDEYYNRASNSFAEVEILSMMRDVDRLTGLMNRRSFYERAAERLTEARERGEQLTFAHFNIINFKVFNEEHGFEKGDDLLCRVAYVLRGEFAGELVARLDNDHFVVCAALGAEAVAERVTRIHTMLASVYEDIRVEVKAGVYELEDDVAEVGIACDHARVACNSVKRRYDRVFGVYDGGLYAKLKMQQYVLATVDEAVERDYIKVYYQPVVRVSTGKICGYEALARWDDPKMGFLPPSQFISTLEEFHMINKVDGYVVEHVCADLRELMDAGEPVVPVSLNLSRLDFELSDVFDRLAEIRERYRIPCELLDIEVTESALNSDGTFLGAVVKRFRDAGHRIWVDDFGSGYSSLNNLLDYDFDVLKLDLEFLRTYDEHPRAGELIRTIVSGARGLGVQPLQEGVESLEHLELLRSIGCEMAQGYYFARPMMLTDSRRVTREKGLEWE